MPPALPEQGFTFHPLSQLFSSLLVHRSYFILSLNNFHTATTYGWQCQSRCHSSLISFKFPNPHNNALPQRIYSFFDILVSGQKRNILYNSILLECTELEHLSVTPVFKALFMSTAFTCFSSFPQRNSKTDLSLLSDLYSSLLLYTEKFLHWGFFP